jgi:hypothetical protein
MCIVCNSEKKGLEYLAEMQNAINSLKKCEKILLHLSDMKNIEFEPSDKKAKNYNKAHKELVRIRKRLGDVDAIREGKYKKTVRQINYD